MFDLVVVGTGFASSFFLKKYLEKRPNDKILVLERGGFFSTKYRINEASKKALGEVNYISSPTHPASLYHNEGGKLWFFDPNFGGGSNCWTGCTPRFMPSDFQMKTLYGKGQDWPISYQDLMPYYQEAEEIMHIAGPDRVPFPKDGSYPLPPHEGNAVDKILMAHYGDQYIIQPTARASKSFAQRNKCCNTGICHLCPMNAKFTIENGMSSIYEHPNVEIRYDAEVISLDLSNDHAKEIFFFQEGKEHRIKANFFAIGANPFFNANILLNSGDKHPLLGKGVGEQKGCYAYVYLDGLDNFGGSTTITANGYMLYDGPHRSSYAACLIESHSDFYTRHEAGRWRQIAKFKFVFEDLYEDSNQILSSGEPSKPKVSHMTNSGYAEAGKQALESQIESLFAMLPIEKIALDPNFQPTEAHILGATRMSKDKSEGVVDKHLLHHQYRNVAILGGSVFSTMSPANPSLTIAALSLWSAERLFDQKAMI